nr:Chain A, smart chimeric peptide G6 [Arenicola marina]
RVQGRWKVRASFFKGGGGSGFAWNVCVYRNGVRVCHRRAN